MDVVNGVDRHVDLYVRSSQDGNSLGACPFCQQLHMMVWLKNRSNSLDYDLHLIDPTRPPKDFTKFANRLPVLKHADDVISDNSEIVEYLNDNFPEVNLIFNDALANAVCLEVFSKFSYYIRQVSTSHDQLRQELWRINDHFLKNNYWYLCGDALTNLDLLVIPKLHHIRIAAFALKGFVIPKSMTGIWTYLRHVYATDVFRNTCPSDQEIVHHWSSKADTADVADEDTSYYSTDGMPRYTLTTPLDEEPEQSGSEISDDRDEPANQGYGEPIRSSNGKDSEEDQLESPPYELSYSVNSSVNSSAPVSPPNGQVEKDVHSQASSSGLTFLRLSRHGHVTCWPKVGHRNDGVDAPPPPSPSFMLSVVFRIHIASRINRLLSSCSF